MQSENRKQQTATTTGRRTKREQQTGSPVSAKQNIYKYNDETVQTQIDISLPSLSNGKNIEIFIPKNNGDKHGLLRSILQRSCIDQLGIGSGWLKKFFFHLVDKAFQ